MVSLLAFEIMAQQTAFILFGCSLFAACLFFYVFYQAGDIATGEEKTRQLYLQERKEAAYENLRDLHFEYKAGKLSEEDYAIQRAALEDEAAAILAEIEAIEAARPAAASSRRAPQPRGGRA